MDTLDDADACVECVPSTDCFNDCAPCEYCIGRPAPAADCDGTGGAGGAPNQPQCPEGRVACTEETPCPETQYCLTGCCVPRVR
jgi:hypothetical protein